jgi:hypothetical protein
MNLANFRSFISFLNKLFIEGSDCIDPDRYQPATEPGAAPIVKYALKVRENEHDLDRGFPSIHKQINFIKVLRFLMFSMSFQRSLLEAMTFGCQGGNIYKRLSSYYRILTMVYNFQKY